MASDSTTPEQPLPRLLYFISGGPTDNEMGIFKAALEERVTSLGGTIENFKMFVSKPQTKVTVDITSLEPHQLEGLIELRTGLTGRKVRVEQQVITIDSHNRSRKNLSRLARAAADDLK